MMILSGPIRSFGGASLASLICSLGDHKIPNYNKTTFTIDHQKQQQANRGILPLPSETLNAMDYLVDRLNASSGQIPATAAAVMLTATTGTAPSLRSDAIINSGAAESSSTSSSDDLVGTNDGVGLSRSLRTAHTAS